MTVSPTGRCGRTRRRASNCTSSHKMAKSPNKEMISPVDPTVHCYIGIVRILTRVISRYTAVYSSMNKWISVRLIRVRASVRLIRVTRVT